MIVMNVLCAGAAYPAGAAADRIRPRTLLFLGLVLLMAADVALALATSPPIVLAGAALWGLHMACTQGLLAKLVADIAPAEPGANDGIVSTASLIVGVAAAHVP
jgi:MFS family permease